MKIKIFFLISAMNALSYLCFGNCCDECCDDCCENCWKCWEESFGKGNIKEKFFLEEKENNEEIKKFVNENWLNWRKIGDAELKFYEKKHEKDKAEYIEVIKYTNGKIEVKNFNTGNNTQKWALFEIKTTENNTVYLYCSDIESTEDDGIFSNMKNFSSISVLACDTSSVKNMNYMFFGCSNLGDLDLSKFDIRDVINMQGMFSNCFNLKEINFPDKSNTITVVYLRLMFTGCNQLNKLTVKNKKAMDNFFEVLKEKSNVWEVNKEDDKFILTKVEKEA